MVSCLLTVVLISIQNANNDFAAIGTVDTSMNWSFLAPLILLGIAYSIYAGALWSSIPYVVKPNTLGTAFGLCTAV